MKFKILAAIAVAFVVLSFAGPTRPAQAVSGNGPQDHTWAIVYTPAAMALNSNPQVQVTLTLGTAILPASGLPDTTFFHDATTTYNGLTPAAGTLGDTVGSIAFDIQTNITGVAGNIDPLTGQPPSCNAAGTSHVTVPATKTTILSATTDPSKLVVSTQADPTHSGFSYDQEPDLSAGGVPLAVTHLPDWYLPVLSALNVPTGNVTARGWAGAVVGPNHTSVSFLTVNATGGKYVAVTLLGDPRGTFSESGQSSVTCPPFSSTVTNLGTSTPGGTPPGISGGGPWGCPTNDYFQTLITSYGTCGGTTAAPGGATLQTVTGTGCGATCPYKIALSTSADLDNDGRLTQDNCPVDFNPTQTDANSNGIGDACKGGGSVWTNVATTGIPLSVENGNASATTNAGLKCGSVDATPHGPGAGPLVAETSAPWAACQDADQDGALNAVDNCPLTPNGPRGSWLELGPFTITGASNVSPIVITTSAPHTFAGGQQVFISGVLGNTAANGVFAITVLSPTTFSLNGSTGNGVYISGGTVVAPLDVQGDNDRDGIGNACDPQPNIAGTGTGYAPTAYDNMDPAGPAAPFTPAFAAGGYHDYSDVCDQGFKVGTGAVAATCQTTSATDPGLLDSNNDGVPDFSNVASTVPTGATPAFYCTEDHKSDSNADGYSDAMQAAPSTSTVTACQVSAGAAANGMPSDPLRVASGCFTDPYVAKSDLNADGGIDGSDLVLFAAAFGQSPSDASDPNNEADINHDGSVDGSDLVYFAAAFGGSVSTLCGPGTGVTGASAQSASLVQPNVWAVAWDHQTAGTHTIAVSCTGPNSASASASEVVRGAGGKVSYNAFPSTGPKAWTCSFTFDTVAVPVVQTFP